MNNRDLYGIFAGGKWGMVTTKRRALQLAKKHNGIVMVIRGGMGSHWASCRVFDAPTFKAQADTVADYRPTLTQPSN